MSTTTTMTITKPFAAAVAAAIAGLPASARKLVPVAVELGRSEIALTEKQLSAALRAAGAKPRTRALRALIGIARTVAAARAARCALQRKREAAEFSWRYRFEPRRMADARTRFFGKPFYAIRHGYGPIWLGVRRNSRTLAAVETAARDCLRNGAAGGSDWDIELLDASAPGDVFYEVRVGRDYRVYKGRFKGYPARTDTHVIRVPRDWRRRVEAIGLATAGGLLTLDARPVDPGKPDVEAWEAVWVEQGRGYAVQTVRGFIARTDRRIHHAATLVAAVRGATAPVRSMPEESVRKGLATRWERAYGSVPVTLQDSLDALAIVRAAAAPGRDRWASIRTGRRRWPA